MDNLLVQFSLIFFFFFYAKKFSSQFNTFTADRFSYPCAGDFLGNLGLFKVLY
jgi:hypothetical protein